MGKKYEREREKRIVRMREKKKGEKERKKNEEFFSFS